jgi:hypothetical protein
VTGRERVAIAMRLGEPDRVPVMCQLAMGHYFLRSGLDPIDIWYSGEAFGEALVSLQRRYGFDGILVNLPGRDEGWRRHVASIETRDDQRVIRWRNGWSTVFPTRDLPWVCRDKGARTRPAIGEIDPDDLFYVEPHGLLGARFPFSPDLDATPRRQFPSYQFDTIRFVLAKAGDVSVHAELFSPFAQLLELADHASVLMALLLDPARVHACLDRLAAGAAMLGVGQAATGADAILISSAFAGAGFISPGQYREFVLPYEKRVVDAIRATSAVPIYTHTCGAIGDRIELMADTGTSGIDTLDPPPLGTVDLANARRQTIGRLFLKGNIDPVHTVLLGTPEDVARAARERISIAGPGGGYILSTACAVPPAAPPENIFTLVETARAYGSYPLTSPGPRSVAAA